VTSPGLVLTRRNREVLAFMAEHEQRHGDSPTYRQIADHFRLRAISSVAEHVQTLFEYGYLRRIAGRQRCPYRLSPMALESIASPEFDRMLDRALGRRIARAIDDTPSASDRATLIDAAALIGIDLPAHGGR
jgi:SOS-response transcriptional repressor LexA